MRLRPDDASSAVVAGGLVTGALVAAACGPATNAPTPNAPNSTQASPVPSSPVSSSPVSNSPMPNRPAEPTNVSDDTAPSAPSAASPGEASGKLVLPAAGGTARFGALDIAVVDVTEKRTMDGSSMMRVTLRLRAGSGDETVQIFSDAPKLTWHGFELEYHGGWRDEVRLTVKQLKR